MRVPPPAESAPEVAVEDILLEAYAPVPASRRTTIPPPLPLLPRVRAESSIDIRVDDLVRSSLEAAPPPPPELHQDPPVGWTTGPTPLSFSPVTMPSAMPLPAVFESPLPSPRQKRSAAVVVMTMMGLFVSAALLGFLVAAPQGSIAGAKNAVLALASKKAPAATPAPKAAAPAPAYTNEPAVVPPAPSNVGVPVDSLPKITVDPKMTAIRFQEKGAPHRVFVDGKLVSTTAKPLETRCGKHAIKIGGNGKSRMFDLPCGAEFTLF